MTFGNIEDRARELSRVSTSGVSQANCLALIDDAIEQFSIDVHGFPQEAQIALTELFDLETTHAFNLTIVGGANELDSTDVVVTSAAAENQTGAETATSIETMINAAISDGSVSVSYTDYYFTIDAGDSTSITIAEPDNSTAYVDATPIYFGKTGTQADTSWVGGFPEDCTLEASLPSDALFIDHVEWDGNALREAPRHYFMSPGSFGTPQYYSVNNSKIRLYPVPEEQKKFYVEYRGVPARTSSPTSNTVVSTSIPSIYHKALAYLVASELARYQHETDIANNLYQQYWRERSKYVCNYANQRTDTGKIEPTGLWYRVVT